MPTFTYSAVNAAGKTVKGTIEADSQQQVVQRLRDQKYAVLEVARPRAGVRKAGRRPMFARMKLQPLVVFSRQFATMLDAGISILRCLDILEGQCRDPVLRTAIGTIKDDVKGGHTLTDSMTKHPHVFSKLYVNMVKAAEAGGLIGPILDRISGFLEKEMEIRGKIKSAMMYPVLVLIFAGIMVCALMLFVLPKFKEIFVSMNVEMPRATALLFAASDFFRHFWFAVIGLPVGAFVAVKLYGRSPKGRYNVDAAKLRLPLVGDLVQKMSIARFARTLGTLVSSGVPMLRALEIVAETTGNAVITKAIIEARASIREGQRISTPLVASGQFPGMVTQMIDVGEETGRISEMLVKVADFYDQEVDATVKGLTSMIEPMLIVVLGTLVGFIAVSVMAPIFKLVSSLS
jgi:type IV pilus assembly protein PilC